MSKRFNISSFIEGIIFIVVTIFFLLYLGMFFLLILGFSVFPSENYYVSFCGYSKEILIFSFALLSFYLSFFLFTKNRLILKLMYKIKKNNLKRRLFYIVLLPAIIIIYGMLTLGNPSYPTDIGQDNFLNSSLSSLNFLLRCMYDISIGIGESLGNCSFLLLIPICFVVFFLLPIFMPILVDILVSYEPWVFITSLKQEMREKICRIYNSIPCTFLVWTILSLALSMPFISYSWDDKYGIGIECFIPICISVLITFPAVITDGMEKAVNFIKRHFIKLLIPLYLLLKLIIVYFDSLGCSAIGFGSIVMLIVSLTLYTPFKRCREENQAIRAEIKSELGI